MIVCVMSHQTVKTPPVIAAGCVTQGVMVAVCDTQGNVKMGSNGKSIAQHGE